MKLMVSKSMGSLSKGFHESLLGFGLINISFKCFLLWLPCLFPWTYCVKEIFSQSQCPLTFLWLGSLQFRSPHECHPAASKRHSEKNRVKCQLPGKLNCRFLTSLRHICMWVLHTHSKQDPDSFLSGSTVGSPFPTPSKKNHWWLFLI